MERKERKQQEDLVETMHGRLLRQETALAEQQRKLESIQASPAVTPVPAPAHQPQHILYDIPETSEHHNHQIHPSVPQSISIQQTTLAQPAPMQHPKAAQAKSFKPQLPAAYTSKKYQEIDDWIFSMNKYFAVASGLPGNQGALRAVMNIQGDALTQFRSSSLNPRVLTWEDFQEALRSTLRSLDYFVRAWDALDTFRQTGSVAEYIAADRKWPVQCQNSVGEDKSLHRYVRSLKDEPRVYVRLQGPQTLVQAYQIVDRWESS